MMNRGSLAASVVGISSAVLVAVACGGKAPPPAPPLTNETVEPGTGGSTAAEAGVPAGVTDGALWTCQIGDYDPQPCKFHREGNEWHLSKLLGSQRFDGVTTFDGDSSIHFVGQFFCPWGDCTEAMDVTFARGEGAAYTAEFTGDTVTVQWNAELAAEWGGAGYGNRTGREIE